MALACPVWSTLMWMYCMQIGVWFTYGCAALECGEFNLAATAFRRCVNLDNDVCIYLHFVLFHHTPKKLRT